MLWRASYNVKMNQIAHYINIPNFQMTENPANNYSTQRHNVKVRHFLLLIIKKREVDEAVPRGKM
jgi:hypothetical protein